MEWKGIVKSVAPVLGNTFGGPFEGAAAKFLSKQLFGDESTSERVLAAHIENANPEQLGEIKRLDNEFETEMAKLGFPKKQLHAREPDKRLPKANVWPQVGLSVLFIIGYFIVLQQVWGLLTTGDETKLKTELVALASGLLGVLTGEVPRILSFWFGSSSGSKDKDAKIRS